MSAAAYLARAGHDVVVVEKNAQPGGRAFTIQQDGFRFELGPSWYMMPDVFDEFFADFGKQVADYYRLQPLSPSYRVFDDAADPLDIADAEATVAVFERIDPRAGDGLKRLLRKTGREYATVRGGILTSDWLRFRQALRPEVLRFLLNPEMIRSYDARVRKYIPSERLQHVLEFMTVFMGGSPRNIPGMYTLLAHVDMGIGIYYPMGGFAAVARAFEQLSEEQGVQYRYGSTVCQVLVSGGRVRGVLLQDGSRIDCDVVVANADYQHVQTELLPPEAQDIPPGKWPKKVLSPSGLLISLGVSGRLPELLHHNLFFDADWDAHFRSVFSTRQWSNDPLFYMCAPSKTDPDVAPPDHENIFILAPQAAGVQPDELAVNRTVDAIMERVERRTGARLADRIAVRDIRTQEYMHDVFNAYQGNAFGLAHTLRQSALFRPRLKARRAGGLYFVGQYTNPGTGVPMVVLSGKTVANTVEHYER